MTVEIPAGLVDQARDDDNPPTLDISQPCPDDISEAVWSLWQITGRLVARVEALES